MVDSQVHSGSIPAHLVLKGLKSSNAPGIRAEAHKLDRGLGPSNLVRSHVGSQVLNWLLHTADALLRLTPDAVGKDVHANGRHFRAGEAAQGGSRQWRGEPLRLYVSEDGIQGIFHLAVDVKFLAEILSEAAFHLAASRAGELLFRV